jgi:hypothetical protein
VSTDGPCSPQGVEGGASDPRTMIHQCPQNAQTQDGDTVGTRTWVSVAFSPLSLSPAGTGVWRSSSGRAVHLEPAVQLGLAQLDYNLVGRKAGSSTLH